MGPEAYRGAPVPGGAEAALAMRSSGKHDDAARTRIIEHLQTLECWSKLAGACLGPRSMQTWQSWMAIAIFVQGCFIYGCPQCARGPSPKLGGRRISVVVQPREPSKLLQSRRVGGKLPSSGSTKTRDFGRQARAGEQAEGSPDSSAASRSRHRFRTGRLVGTVSISCAASSGSSCSHTRSTTNPLSPRSRRSGDHVLVSRQPSPPTSRSSTSMDDHARGSRARSTRRQIWQLFAT